MINKLKSLVERVVVPYLSQQIAEILIESGATIPTRCGHCSRGSPEDCPDGYIWCEKMCRYMKCEGFCSFGLGDDIVGAVKQQMERDCEWTQRK